MSALVAVWTSILGIFLKIQECVSEVTYSNWSVWFVGLSDVQHSAAPFLIKYTGNVGFRYVQF